MEEGQEPKWLPWRRLNPNIMEVVKGEVLKLLDADIMYLMSDYKWVSLIQYVPKKKGTIVMENEQKKLIAIRKIIGWQMCIGYMKPNKATQKDHFPLPFIDQMLEKLSTHAFCCCLDGYSRYLQVPLADKDMHKTIFTCPYKTFAYR